MASRRIYLQIAAFLRSNHVPVDIDEYRHSPLTLQLHGEVIESGLLLTVDAAYLAAYAAMHAHPSADLEKGNEQVNILYYDTMSRVPYLTLGQTGKEMAHASHMELIAEYRKWRAAQLKQVKEAVK